MAAKLEKKRESGQVSIAQKAGQWTVRSLGAWNRRRDAGKWGANQSLSNRPSLQPFPDRCTQSSPVFAGMADVGVDREKLEFALGSQWLAAAGLLRGRIDHVSLNGNRPCLPNGRYI